MIWLRIWRPLPAQPDTVPKGWVRWARYGSAFRVRGRVVL